MGGSNDPPFFIATRKVFAEEPCRPQIANHHLTFIINICQFITNISGITFEYTCKINHVMIICCDRPGNILTRICSRG